MRNGNRSGNTLGRNIRLERKARGWTVRDLARAADINPGNISRVERGERGMRDTSVAKLAKALKVSRRALRE